MTDKKTADRHLLATGAVLMALAVALGAFGAHALDGVLHARAADWWETAVRYHLAHGLGVLVVAGFHDRLNRPPLARVGGWLMVVGVVLFCGSLYLMALTELRALALLTPIGGSLWLVAWCLLAAAALLGPTVKPPGRSG